MGSERMNLGAAIPTRFDQASILKRFQMPRDGLPAECDVVNIDNPKADFEQALIIALSQFIQNQNARVIREGPEDGAQLRIMWKSHDRNMQQ